MRLIIVCADSVVLFSFLFTSSTFIHHVLIMCTVCYYAKLYHMHVDVINACHMTITYASILQTINLVAMNN